MKNIPTTQEEIATAKQKLSEYILSTLTEYSEEIEKAFIDNFFLSIKSNSKTEIDRDQIDSLHLLYQVLQGAKEINKLEQAEILILEQANS